MQDIAAKLTLEELREAWQVNNVINLELLQGLSEQVYDLKPGKGKTIRSNFVHIVSVRRSWSQVHCPTETGSIPQLDWKTATQQQLREGLLVSHDVMAQVLTKLVARGGKSSPLVFFAYFIAHEAHHRSQIETALRLGGIEIDESFFYELWEWDKKARTL